MFRAKKVSREKLFHAKARSSLRLTRRRKEIHGLLREIFFAPLRETLILRVKPFLLFDF
jgi:hypothetical protein